MLFTNVKIPCKVDTSQNDILFSDGARFVFPVGRWNSDFLKKNYLFLSLGNENARGLFDFFQLFSKDQVVGHIVLYLINFHWQ